MNKLKASTNCGFTLIEVMVALLILSIGLLGLAMLQATNLQFNTDAYTRTQATLLAYDIIDRMRANPTGTSNGDYNIAGNSDYTSKIASCTLATCDCSSACNAQALAKYDLWRWYAMQEKYLPGVSTTRSTLNVDANNLARVTINWTEKDIPRTQTWVVQL
ncbi:MAG TPA: type IV pilus modification protein PilV [Candidatus Methylomirabilis sp.]|nr:type IV pilus modification protein PilV [Candidatus Methylomirabilis sp.]